MNDTPRTGLRILVGAGSFADATAALGIVQRLPRDFCKALGGILIEEEDLLATCQIPDQRIILLSGTTSRAPSISQVRTLQKADARAFQRQLAQIALPQDTGWAFTQDKGELVSTALRAAASWDILVLGYRQIHKMRGKVISVHTSGHLSEALTAASRQISNQLHAEPAVFAVKSKRDRTASAHDRTMREFETLDDLLAALASRNAQTVLVDLQQGPVRDHADLLRLLEAARCPVIVFGASNASALLEHNTQIMPAPAKVEPKNDA